MESTVVRHVPPLNSGNMYLDQFEYDDIETAIREWLNWAVLQDYSINHSLVEERGEFHRCVDRIDEILTVARARRIREECQDNPDAF